MTRLLQVIITIATAITLTACGDKSPPQADAQMITHQFFEARMAGDDASAIDHYSSKRPPETWQAHLDHIQTSLGNLERYELKRTEVNTVFSGRYYIFDYSTQYSNGAIAREVVTVFNKVGEEETAIVAHDVTAEGYTPML